MKIPSVLSIFFLILTASGVETGLLSLSNWQYNRYHQRLNEQATFSARPATTVSGTFLPEATFALTNQPNPLNPEAEVGWRILTPLQTASGTLLVDRGYMRPALNPDGTPNFSPATPVTDTVDGVLQPFPVRRGVLRGPDTTTHPRLLAFLNPSLIISETTTTYLIARSSTSPNLVAVPPPLPSPDRHLSYALQWLGLAIAFPLMCLFAYLKSRRKPKLK